LSPSSRAGPARVMIALSFKVYSRAILSLRMVLAIAF